MNKNVTQENNKAVVRRLVEEVLGLGKMSLLDTLIADRHVSHFGIGDHYEVEGLRIHIDAYREAMPKLTVRIDDLFAEGDRVARRFTLVGRIHLSSPTGTLEPAGAVEVHGIAIDRLEDGRIAESWVHIDDAPGWHPNRGE